jgi:hypothetical protein
MLILLRLILVASDQLSNLQIEGSTVYISDTVFGRLLRNNESTTRLAGLALVVASHSITRPFSKGSLNCLRSNFPHLFFETDANSRGEVLGFLQRMLDRLKAATSTLEKDVGRKRRESAKAQAEAKQGQKRLGDAPEIVLEYHKDFLSWFIRFLRAQLHPAAAYQRHITTLRAFIIVAKSGLDHGIDQRYFSKQALGEIKWSFHVSIFSSWLRRNLYELIMNPFDDVRNFAAMLMEMAPELTRDRASSGSDIVPTGTRSEKHDKANTQLFRFLQRSEERMLRSGRADHADGVSRTYALLFKVAVARQPTEPTEDIPTVWWVTKLGIIRHLVEQLETTIDTANSNLSLAVSRFPMHGILSSLR